MPDCLENYYQEAGRAGRDGKRSYAVLLYQSEDIEWLEALPDVRFPSVYNIRKVYQALADYLQIPVGIGEGNYYDFNLGEFANNFQLDLHLVINTLKALEQEGHLSFNESIFLPAQAGFIASRHTLQHFEQTHPSLEPVMKCLLRTYEGIYDNRVSINEKLIAKLTRINLATVKDDLLQLKRLGIIDYLPQKENPQIHFILNRAPAEFLYIDNTAYFKRKGEYEVRVGTMLAFIQLHNTCRAKYLANYFGDNEAKDCGICDNCLKQKNTGIKQDEFKEIEKQVLQILGTGKTTLNALLAQLAGYPKDKCMAVITYLQSEQVITADSMGRLEIKGKA